MAAPLVNRCWRVRVESRDLAFGTCPRVRLAYSVPGIGGFWRGEFRNDQSRLDRGLVSRETSEQRDFLVLSRDPRRFGDRLYFWRLDRGETRLAVGIPL